MSDPDPDRLSVFVNDVLRVVGVVDDDDSPPKCVMFSLACSTGVKSSSRQIELNLLLRINQLHLILEPLAHISKRLGGPARVHIMNLLETFPTDDVPVGKVTVERQKLEAECVRLFNGAKEVLKDQKLDRETIGFQSGVQTSVYALFSRLTGKDLPVNF